MDNANVGTLDGDIFCTSQFQFSISSILFHDQLTDSLLHGLNPVLVN